MPDNPKGFWNFLTGEASLALSLTISKLYYKPSAALLDHWQWQSTLSWQRWRWVLSLRVLEHPPWDSRKDTLVLRALNMNNYLKITSSYRNGEGISGLSTATSTQLLNMCFLISFKLPCSTCVAYCMFRVCRPQIFKIVFISLILPHIKLTLESK